MWGHTARKKHCSRRYWWQTTTSTIQHWFVHKYCISMQFCRSAPENLTQPSKPSGYQKWSIKHHQISIHCNLYEIWYSGPVNVLYIIPSNESENQDTGYLSFIPNLASCTCTSNYLTYLCIIFFGKQDGLHGSFIIPPFLPLSLEETFCLSPGSLRCKRSIKEIREIISHRCIQNHNIQWSILKSVDLSHCSNPNITYIYIYMQLRLSLCTISLVWYNSYIIFGCW